MTATGHSLGLVCMLISNNKCLFGFKLLVAYAAVIECSYLAGWTNWGDRYERIGLLRYMYVMSSNEFLINCMYCIVRDIC